MSNNERYERRASTERAGASLFEAMTSIHIVAQLVAISVLTLGVANHHVLYGKINPGYALATAIAIIAMYVVLALPALITGLFDGFVGSYRSLLLGWLVALAVLAGFGFLAGYSAILVARTLESPSGSTISAYTWVGVLIGTEVVLVLELVIARTFYRFLQRRKGD